MSAESGAWRGRRQKMSMPIPTPTSEKTAGSGTLNSGTSKIRLPELEEITAKERTFVCASLNEPLKVEKEAPLLRRRPLNVPESVFRSICHRHAFVRASKVVKRCVPVRSVKPSWLVLVIIPKESNMPSEKLVVLLLARSAKRLVPAEPRLNRVSTSNRAKPETLVKSGREMEARPEAPLRAKDQFPST